MSDIVRPSRDVAAHQRLSMARVQYAGTLQPAAPVLPDVVVELQLSVCFRGDADYPSWRASWKPASSSSSHTALPIRRPIGCASGHSRGWPSARSRRAVCFTRQREAAAQCAAHRVRAPRQRVGKVERIVHEDVHLGALQRLAPSQSLVEAIDAAHWLLEPDRVQAAHYLLAMRVVGGGDVLEATSACASPHVSEAFAAISVPRVHLQVAAQVLAAQQCGQPVASRRLEPAALLLQRERDAG